MSATSIINEDDKTFYFVSPTGITITGRTRQYDTYDQMLKDKNPPKFAWVFDASGDETVESGAAFYTYKNGTWQKLYESEAMDNENFGRPEGYDDLVLTVDNLKERVKSLAESTVLNDHIANTDIHITVDERNAWNNKVDKEEGKGLSSNDFTNEYISKIADTEAAVIRLDQSKMSLEDGLELHNRIGIAEQEVRDIVDRQTATEATVSAAVSTVGSLSASVESMETKVNKIVTDVTVNTSNINTLIGTVESQEQTISEIRIAIDNVSGNLHTQGLDIKQNKNNLNSLQQSVSTNTRDIADLNTWKDNLIIPESKDYDAEIVGLKEADATLSERLTTLEETVLGASATLSEIEEMV